MLPAEDDLTVPPHERDRWLHSLVVVEEKLDGANVSIWFDGHGRLRVAGRGGPTAMDRAGQLGRLRAWAAERTAQLRKLLSDDLALYGEWLWLQHSLQYDSLPDHLLILDLWSTQGFLAVDERDNRARAAGLLTPPRLFSGVLGHVDKLAMLTAHSAYASGPAEGAVLRRDHADGSFDCCKWVRSGFTQRPDEHWRGVRRYNELAG